MLIPLRHENMQGRRWPVLTIGLIVINLFVFLGTRTKLEQEGKETGEVRVHILMLAAMHPELKVPDSVQQFVTTTQSKHPGIWKALQNPNRDIEDAWDAKMRLQEESFELQQEMDSLAQEYEQSAATSIREHYAFVPAHPMAISYLTSNFLHGGWLHLIGNMWFLWLAGSILEDTWGRIIYPVFYLLAGVFATQVHAWSDPSSFIPALGASGAVAGLMGAFLVRFPTTKIEMGWLLLYRLYRFKAAAYWLLPLWLLQEVFYGSLFGQSSGVAHWAHVGGFLFGVVAGIGIRKSGLEQIAEQAIQEQISWVSHPLLAQANEQLEKNDLDSAEANLKKLLQEKPDSIEAHRMLQQIHWRKRDYVGHREALEKLIGLHVKAKDADETLQTYAEYTNAGGEKLPAGGWLEVCRMLEDQQRLDVAVEEYEKLATAYPAEKQGLLAQMAAGRLCLKRLNRPQDALRLYQAAAASPVPHFDWDANIQRGVEDAQKALGGAFAPAQTS